MPRPPAFLTARPALRHWRPARRRRSASMLPRCRVGVQGVVLYSLIVVSVNQAPPHVTHQSADRNLPKSVFSMSLKSVSRAMRQLLDLCQGFELDFNLWYGSSGSYSEPNTL